MNCSQVKIASAKVTPIFEPAMSPKGALLQAAVKPIIGVVKITHSAVGFDHMNDQTHLSVNRKATTSKTTGEFLMFASFCDHPTRRALQPLRLNITSEELLSNAHEYFSHDRHLNSSSVSVRLLSKAFSSVTKFAINRVKPYSCHSLQDIQKKEIQTAFSELFGQGTFDEDSALQIITKLHFLSEQIGENDNLLGGAVVEALTTVASKFHPGSLARERATKSIEFFAKRDEFESLQKTGLTPITSSSLRHDQPIDRAKNRSNCRPNFPPREVFFDWDVRSQAPKRVAEALPRVPVYHPSRTIPTVKSRENTSLSECDRFDNQIIQLRDAIVNQGDKEFFDRASHCLKYYAERYRPYYAEIYRSTEKSKDKGAFERYACRRMEILFNEFLFYNNTQSDQEEKKANIQKLGENLLKILTGDRHQIW